MKSVALLVMIVMSTILGCVMHTPQNIGVLHDRATYDLQCPPNQMRTYPVADHRTRLVRGCRQEATYTWLCQRASNRYGSWEEGCTWVLNGGPRPMDGATFAAETPPSSSQPRY